MQRCCVAGADLNSKVQRTSEFILRISKPTDHMGGAVKRELSERVTFWTVVSRQYGRSTRHPMSRVRQESKWSVVAAHQKFPTTARAIQMSP